jgi:hypothetical protein
MVEHGFGAVDERDVEVDEQPHPDSLETEPARPNMNTP